MEDLYLSRPFKTRNADEYNLEQVLDLFVSPSEGLSSPFEYENNIIRGRMGSGKTMLLRANHAYYLYNIVPALISGEPPILPVMIRLSDFQHIQKASDIYRSIILRIIEGLATVYLHLLDVANLARIHLGMQGITRSWKQDRKVSETLDQLLRLGADQYVEKIRTQLDLSGKVKPKFFELSADYRRERLLEVQQKSNPGIKDIEDCYLNLLQDRGGQILLLIDEAGAIDKSFFRSDTGDSFFEIMMNQLRTAHYIRTKIAIYPNSYQDILTETRYGDVITLEESVLDLDGYRRLRRKSLDIIDKYINATKRWSYAPQDIFEISNGDFGDAIEQLIYGCGGNLRRLIQLLDIILDIAFTKHCGTQKISIEDASDTLIKHSLGIESHYSPLEVEFLDSIAKACRNRSTYRFTFPYMTPALNKYTSKSQEYNLLKIVELGVGRKSTTYAFDYSYCVANDIPTHYQSDSEKIDRTRSLETGRWITRIVTISEDILKEASHGPKYEGTIVYCADRGGFIATPDGTEYYFSNEFLIESSQRMPVCRGQKVYFIPFPLEKTNMALNVEIVS